MNKMLGMAVAVALSAAATLSFAQTTPPTPPVAPPAATAPATPPATPPAGETPAPAPATPASATEAAPSTPATNGACRTRKAEGEACACLKDPDTVGTAQAAPNGGRNICVVP